MDNPTPKRQSTVFTQFKYPANKKRFLHRSLHNLDKEFLEVILSRNSDPNILSSLSENELSELLLISTKIRSIHIDNDGYVITKRTTPSAGGRHPVDILVSQFAPSGNRSLSYYNPIDHSLSELLVPAAKLQDFYSEVNLNLPLEEACLIWFSIQKEKTGSKYYSPQSLYWRDTGALLYCIQLASTYLGYKSCPIGTLANATFNLLFNNPKLASGGGILIGK